ncbi:MAG: SurA N-terminal domain-containing protein [Pseudomonadales bacterium]
MLQELRNQTQGVAFKIVVGMLIVVLAVFGFGAIDLFGSNDPDLARINGESLTQGQVGVQVERERRRIAAQAGDSFDPASIDPLALQARVLEQMIARALIQQAADDLGVAASDREVTEIIRNNPNFGIDGKFEQERFRIVAQAMGYRPQDFVAEMRELLKLEQLQNAIANSGFSTTEDLGVYARILGQRRDLAWLSFTPDRFAAQAGITDEDVRQRYDDNQSAYMTEESLDVEYLELSVSALASDAGISVSEDDVVAAYDADRAAAPVGEERRSSHILVSLTEERDEAAARQVIATAVARLAAGEAFAVVAKELSDDPVSAQAGGDLGFAGRGVFDPAFEDALFALTEPGALSEPVVTPFGVHLIQLEEIRETEYPALDQLRQEIEERLRTEQANQRFDERKRELDNLAFERPDDLLETAATLGLEVQTSSGITRDSGAGLFASALVREALFAADVLEKGLNSPLLEPETGVALVARVIKRHEPIAIPFDTLAEQLKSEMVTEAAAALAEEARSAAEERLRKGEAAAEIALTYGLSWQRVESARLGATDVPREVLDAAFRLDRPAADGKTVGTAPLSEGGTALITVTRVQDGSLGALTTAERQGLERIVAERVARLEFGSFYETLEEQASIRRFD